MAEVEWHQCRFLESSENLKPLVRKRFGREPSTSVARDTVACLQQGRLFYEAASTSPLEIRPLQLFYGMVGFSKALIIASRCQSLSTLRQAHGVSDVSAGNSRVADLRLRIDSGGTFHEFNDVVAELSRVCYIDTSNRHRTIHLPSTKSDKLRGIELTLRETLSRIPGLEGIYRMTFGEEPNVNSVLFDADLHDDTAFSVRIDDPRLFADRESLKQIVNRWRERFPFLVNWRLASAQHAWGKSVIIFRNTHTSCIDEFSEMRLLVDEGGSFEASTMEDGDNDRFPPKGRLHPLAGGFPGPAGYAVSPVQSLHVSEFSLHYLTLFLLSSLVRYRPQTWMHAISRSVMPDAPADDQALSLIGQFLDLNFGSIPPMVATVLNPYEDDYANVEA